MQLSRIPDRWKQNHINAAYELDNKPKSSLICCFYLTKKRMIQSYNTAGTVGFLLTSTTSFSNSVSYFYKCLPWPLGAGVGGGGGGGLR